MLSVFTFKTRSNPSRPSVLHECWWLLLSLPFTALVPSTSSGFCPQKRAPVLRKCQANGHFSVPHITKPLNSIWHYWSLVTISFSKFGWTIVSLLVLISLATCFLCWLLFLWLPYKPTVLRLKKQNKTPSLNCNLEEEYQGECRMGMVG